MTVDYGGLTPAPLNAPDGQQASGGVQPGQSNAIIFANKVIVFGPAEGVFVYNGTPALGNPPIFWATSSATDPFGNAIPNGSTAGVAGSGVFAAGNTLITPAGLFIYSGAPALGNLIYSDVSAAGTDPKGNTVLAGANAYLTISGITYAVGLNTLSGTGLPGLSIGDVAHPPTSPAGFFGEASSNVSTPNAFAAVTSGQANGTDVASFISILSQLQSAVTGGQIVLQAGDVQHDLGGSLIDYTSNATGSIIATETNGDTNQYHLGHKVVSNAAVNVTSTTPVNLLLIGPLAAGKGYHIAGFAIYHGNQAAGVPAMNWAGNGGLVLGGQQTGFSTFALSGGGTHINNAALGAANGPTLLNAGVQIYQYDIYVNVTTGGNLAITGAEGTAGDSWAVDHIYALFEEF